MHSQPSKTLAGDEIMQALAITTDCGSLTFTAPRIQSSYLKKHLKPTRVCFSNFGSFPNSRLLLSLSSASQKPIVPSLLVTASSSSSSSSPSSPSSSPDSNVFKNLSPTVRKRVEVLIEIEEQYIETKAKFFEERSVLEAKYLKLYQPLFTKRYEIVNGEDEDEVGVSDFWLTVLKKNEITGEDINERDEDALKYLKDIKLSILEGSSGFKLEFSFDQNPYFKDTVLTKEYTLLNMYSNYCLWRTEGTRNIKWYPGNRLIPKIGSEYFESFFNFFNPDEYGIWNLANPRDSDIDFLIAKTIKDEIISHAVSLFTGNLSPVLREIQKQYDELEAKYLEERAGLDAKYHKLYQPFYTKRYEIVNGVVEVEGEDKSTEEKGVPDFWLTVLKSNAYTSYEVNERDEDALKYLKDIKWSMIEEEDSNWWSMPEEPKWWKIEFFFDDKNPYFKNSVLTKTYKMTSGDVYSDIDTIIGTEIEWYPGNCLTSEDFVSFFHFFSPSPNYFDDDNDDDDEEEEEDLEFSLALEYKYKIIPLAVFSFLEDVPVGGYETDEEDPDPDYDDDDDYWEEVFSKPSSINSETFKKGTNKLLRP